MKNILILIVFSLMTIGCGGSTDNGSNVPDAPGIIPEKGDTEMILNELYAVSTGDQIIRSTSLTRIEVTHVDGSISSSVVLLEGNAIIRVK